MTESEMHICERFAYIRSLLNMRQGDFAKEIRLTQGHVSDIENKRKGVSDRVIEIISLKFGISEEWLRYGTGEIHNNLEEDEYTKIAVQIDRGDKRARQAIIDYWHLSPGDKELFWQFVERIAGYEPLEKNKK